METWVAAISIGLVSSFHCLGMCGPIAFAVPMDRSSLATRMFGGFSYNLGRIVTYILLGLAFGLIGKSLVMAGAQRFLSIAAGVFMIASVVLPRVWKKANIDAVSFQFIGKLKGHFTDLFKKRSISAIFTIGLLNGLLPCAMVYIALAGAIAEGDMLGGGAFMMWFGIGTLPMMYSASILGGFLTHQFRNKLQKAIPVIVVVMGLLFIVRGLNLDIHYLSPKIDRVDPAVTQCD